LTEQKKIIKSEYQRNVFAQNEGRKKSEKIIQADRLKLVCDVYAQTHTHTHKHALAHLSRQIENLSNRY